MTPLGEYYIAQAERVLEEAARLDEIASRARIRCSDRYDWGDLYHCPLSATAPHPCASRAEDAALPAGEFHGAAG